jgi:hypothetical protein
MERCRLMKGDSFVNCDTFTQLDIDQPGTSPNAHFTYTFNTATVDSYIITGTRNTINGGDGTSTIVITQAGNTVTRSGTSSFLNIQ